MTNTKIYIIEIVNRESDDYEGFSECNSLHAFNSVELAVDFVETDMKKLSVVESGKFEHEVNEIGNMIRCCTHVHNGKYEDRHYTLYALNVNGGDNK